MSIAIELYKKYITQSTPAYMLVAVPSILLDRGELVLGVNNLNQDIAKLDDPKDLPALNLTLNAATIGLEKMDIVIAFLGGHVSGWLIFKRDTESNNNWVSATPTLHCRTNEKATSALAFFNAHAFITTTE